MTVIGMQKGFGGVKWGIDDVSAVFLASALFSGIVGKLHPSEIANSFVKGAGGAVGGALVIGFARGVYWVMNSANINATIVYNATQLLKGLPPLAAAIGIVILVSFINGLIPSGSGKGALLAPIIVPIAMELGLTSQTAVLAYQFGDGITNMFWFSYGTLMIFLNYAKVPVQKWYKFFLPLMAIYFLFAFVSMGVAIAIGFSALNALTLSPALCAIFLKPHEEHGEKKSTFVNRFHTAFNTHYDNIVKKYKKHVLFFIQKKWLSAGIVTASVVLLIVFMNITPTGMVPNEDTGTIMGVVTLPPGTSQERAMEVLNRVDSLVAADPAVESRTVISGFSFIGGQGPSYGSLIIKLKNWEERSTMQNSTIVYATLFMRAQKIIKEAQVLFFAPPMIPGYSASSDIELNMQDKTGGDLNHFFEVVNNYTAALEARPEINSAKTSFNPNFPQYMLDIDAAACKKAGISPSDILSTMQGYFGGLYASNFNSFGKMYRVMIQAEPDATKNLESLASIKVRNGNEMAPITQFVSIKKIYGPDIISRFNLYTSMKVMVAPATGYTSGQALAAISEVAKENLPTGFSYELGGMAREEAETSGSTTGLIFVLCFVFVYLLLSAQYESYILPLAVLLSIPFGLLGSFLFVNGMSAIGNIPMLKMIMGSMSNDIYMQIALIMLMGLLAKNAILIIEFALDRRKMGMSITWAAVLGAAARLRPILMTSLAMIVGLIPLMMASGAGANGNRTLGTSAIGGMLIGMILQIFIVPALFVAFQYLQEKIKPMEWADVDNSDAEPEIEQYTK
mgnify:CR=1 FL=1